MCSLKQLGMHAPEDTKIDRFGIESLGLSESLADEELCWRNGVQSCLTWATPTKSGTLKLKKSYLIDDSKNSVDLDSGNERAGSPLLSKKISLAR